MKRQIKPMAVPGIEPGGADMAQPRFEWVIKIVDVFVCKLRKKLVPFGIEILTRWGVGYFMEPATKDRVRAMVEASAGVAG